MEKKCQIKTQTKIEEEIKDFREFFSQENSQIDSSGKIREGKWNQDENLKFVIFIHENSDIFKSKEKRKAQRIFINLSTFIGSRSARQCRSHFQKIMKKFPTIVKLKNYYKGVLGTREFEMKVEELKPKIQMINQELRSKQDKVMKVQASVQTETMVYSAEAINNWMCQSFQNMYWHFPTFY